jgi:phosphatidylinositol phospholipase C delta
MKRKGEEEGRVNQDGNECPDERNRQPVEGQGEEKGSGLWPPWKRKPKTKQPKVKISDELAELGYYARSMKPRKGWLDQRKSLLTFPSLFFLRPALQHSHHHPTS